MPYQTIFYEKATGLVLKIEPNFLINKARQKEEHCPGRKHNEIGVFYLEGRDPVELQDITVKPSGDFGDRLVLNKEGRPLSLERVIEKFADLVSGRDAIRYEAEGGLGDHLLQAAACLEFKAKFPGKWVGLMVKRQYESILQRVEGLDKIGADLTLNRIPAGALYVSGKTEYMSDPRGLGYGKQSLYGTHLGLESVRRLARIQISDNIVTAGKEFLKTYQWEEKRPLIGIQFASASGWAKSWPLRHVRDLVKLIYAETEGEAVIFGRNWEYPVDSPLGMNLTGPLTWETTLEVLSLCRAVVCVDSGILHLSRAIGKKYACLWGGSTPEYILGERLGAYDVQLEMDCKNRLCMECPKKRPLCMENLTPDLVIEKIKAMIQEGGAEENG